MAGSRSSGDLWLLRCGRGLAAPCWSGTGARLAPPGQRRSAVRRARRTIRARGPHTTADQTESPYVLRPRAKDDQHDHDLPWPFVAPAADTRHSMVECGRPRHREWRLLVASREAADSRLSVKGTRSSGDFGLLRHRRGRSKSTLNALSLFHTLKQTGPTWPREILSRASIDGPRRGFYALVLSGCSARWNILTPSADHRE